MNALDRQLHDRLLRSDFKFFLRQAFATVFPGTPFQPNWHLDHIGWLLSEVERGRVRRLLINQPPRSLKSVLTSVVFPAWILGHRPEARIMVVSHSHELAGELHRQFRMIVETTWFQHAYRRFGISKDTNLELVTTRGGGRLATSVGGTVTGRGADLIIVDDPHNAGEIHSEAARRRVTAFFSEALLSRLNDKGGGAIVVVMQRLHQDDLAGHLLDQGGWQQCNLPAIAIEPGSFPLIDGSIHHRSEGDLLQPVREDRKVLDRLKIELGSAVFSAQYQQQPIPPSGVMFKREWFRTYDAQDLLTIGKRGRVFQSWDVAFTTGNSNDWSVCTTWRKVNNDYYLLDVDRGRWSYPEVRGRVDVLAERFSPIEILIEDVGPGATMVQDFEHDRKYRRVRPIGVKPIGSKLDRAAAASAKVAAGQVFIPRSAGWLDTFLLETLGFPNTKHDDQVDSLSQALNTPTYFYTLDNI